MTDLRALLSDVADYAAGYRAGLAEAVVAPAPGAADDVRAALGELRDEPSNLCARCASDQLDLNLVHRRVDARKLTACTNHLAVHTVDTPARFLGEAKLPHCPGKHRIPRLRRVSQDVFGRDPCDQSAGRADDEHLW